jgi:hypothetical protein
MKPEMYQAGKGMVSYERIYILNAECLHTHKFCHQNGERSQNRIDLSPPLREIYAQTQWKQGSKIITPLFTRTKLIVSRERYVRSKQDIKSVADIPRRRKEWAAALFGGERLDAADARDSSSLQ